MEKAEETLMNRSQTPIRRTWALLIAGPSLFLAVIIVASVYWGIGPRGDAQAIAEQTPKSMPVILAAVQLLLLVFLVRTLRSERLAWSAIGWRLEPGQVLWREVLIGVVPGAVLAVLYFTVLSPAMMSLQRNVGDYVPPGELAWRVGCGPRAVLPGQCPARSFRGGRACTGATPWIVCSSAMA